MSTLEEINKQIEDVQKQSADLKSQMESQKARLAEAREEQKDLILKSQSTNKIEAEIISLRTKIQGTQSAIESLDITLKGLQENKKRELNKIHLIEAEQAKSESQKTVGETYTLLAEFVKKVTELEVKKDQYRAALRKADPKTADSKISKLTFLVQSLKKGSVQLLQGYPFPDEIFKDGTLPKADELKKLLHSPSAISFDPHGRLEPPERP